MSDTKTKDTGVSLTYINNNYIRSDGNTPVTGSTDKKGNTLYNVSDPVNPHDVATKEYTDKKRKHVIAINMYYIGPLRKGEYQFPVGGEGKTLMYSYKVGGGISDESGCPGFLVPHSGRIVKVIMKTPINKTFLKNYFISRNKVDLDILLLVSLLL